MEEMKDGKKVVAETVNETLHLADGFDLKIMVGSESFQVFAKTKHLHKGPDVLTIGTPVVSVTDDQGQPITGDLKDLTDKITDLGLSFRTTFAPGAEIGRLRCIIGEELTEIALDDFGADDWRAFADKLLARNADRGLLVPESMDGAIPIPGRAESFTIPGGYVRPIFGLSERKQDLPLLLEFHEPQTPLNWAVGLALFSLTDADKVRAGEWQEASIRDLEDRVFRLTEDRPRRGDHREDILAEVVKLHTKRNWYYEIETVQVGRAWMNRATIGSQYAIPEIQLIYLDTKTGKRTFPSDPAIRALLIPLSVKGRRAAQLNGKEIPSLPKDRWQLESVRWRWIQSFNEDLLRLPALHESGKRKGLPKKTTTGKALRKGYLIKVADNIFTALGKLRAEGSGSKYACRLLIMLASNLNKTEDGIAADRVFRMLGIAEDYQEKEHRKPEDIVARAVLRLKERDIRALLVGSDEYPRTDPNPDRRKGPYYRFRRSAEYTPRGGIVTKEDALAIEAEYQAAPAGATFRPLGKSAERTEGDNQPTLPGMAEEGPTVPSGAEIRAAREAAGLNLRRFAEAIGGPDFSTWSRYETGKPIRVGSIAPEVWQRVRDFIKTHGSKGT